MIPKETQIPSVRVIKPHEYKYGLGSQLSNNKITTSEKSNGIVVGQANADYKNPMQTGWPLATSAATTHREAFNKTSTELTDKTSSGEIAKRYSELKGKYSKNPMSKVIKIKS